VFSRLIRRSTGFTAPWRSRIALRGWRIIVRFGVLYEGASPEVCHGEQDKYGDCSCCEENRSGVGSSGNETMNHSEPQEGEHRDDSVESFHERNDTLTSVRETTVTGRSGC